MTQATILVADQEAENLRQLGSIFQTAGYIPITVSGAKEAMETIVRFHPDLFVLNPTMAGLEAFSLQNRNAKERKMPPMILAVAEQTLPSLRKKYLTHFGAATLVTAPFSSTSVILAVENLLGKPHRPLLQDSDPNHVFSDVDETLSELVQETDSTVEDSGNFHSLSELLSEVSTQSQELTDLSDHFQTPTKPLGESRMFTAGPQKGPDLSDVPPSSTVRVSAEEVQRQMAKIRKTLAQGPQKKPMPTLPKLPQIVPENKPHLRYTQGRESSISGFESGALTSSDIFGALIHDIETGKVTQKEEPATVKKKRPPASEKEPNPIPPVVPQQPQMLEIRKPLGPFATQPIPLEDRPEIPNQKLSQPTNHAPPTKTLPTGNQYQLLKKIAAGGMAEVWKAKLIGEKGFEKIVAIKKILPHLSDNDEFITMFIDEAKVAANLTHPNIAQIYELGKMGDSFFIAMEYVGGNNLRQILNFCKAMEINIAPEIAAFIGMKLCNALNYAHLKKGYDQFPLNIVHRDVSPQNILISHEGEIKLVDFGIAKASIKASQTVAGSLKGKLLYMSPEQADGKLLDGRSDTFSLTSVLYETVTGKKLFAGDSELSVLKNVRQANFLPPRQVNPDIPLFLEEILLKNLSKQPGDRYDSAKELEKAFKSYFNREKLHLTESDIADYLQLIIDKNAKALRAFGQNRPRSQGPFPPQRPIEARTSAISRPKAGVQTSQPPGKHWLIWLMVGLITLAGGWWLAQNFLLKSSPTSSSTPAEGKFNTELGATKPSTADQPTPTNSTLPSATQPLDPATAPITDKKKVDKGEIELKKLEQELENKRKELERLKKKQ